MLGEGRARWPDLKVRLTGCGPTSGREQGRGLGKAVKMGAGACFRQDSGHEYLKPSGDWHKQLAPITEKSRDGLQTQLDPGALIVSPRVYLPSLFP